MSSTAYNQLNQALIEAGLPGRSKRRKKGVTFEDSNPIDFLVNVGIPARPYEEILLKYAPRLRGNELSMVVRVMNEKGMNACTPFLPSLFTNNPGNKLKTDLWVAGGALYTINDKRTYPQILAICRDRSFGSDRQLLMGTPARMKSDEAYRVLVDCLNDSTVRAHAIEALGRMGRTEAIDVLEPLAAEKGLYEFKAKNTALRRLRRKLEAKRSRQ